MQDLGKAHDGTTKFAIQDARIGAHSRRGDMDLLGYNLLQWLYCRLSWEENLKKANSPSNRQTVHSLAVVIAALTSSSEVELLAEGAAVPVGCAVTTISDTCQAYLMLKGVVDPAKEMERLSQKQEKLETQLSKLKTAMSAADYTTKVPAEVQATNLDKVRQSEGELARIAETIRTLKLMD
ncbi:hypothetical protein HPB52_019183 [Rhipicephalus sanguineus]|uniref:valine--tRNA ligase n=1 Tax=Rhipicephalus sanguineus TaxID=34632 RepID=A0A9D4TBF5_RHISA|nr:hypothetical protein HPB52_019183 [Rhipicephalus sanguineus]